VVVCLIELSREAGILTDRDPARCLRDRSVRVVLPVPGRMFSRDVEELAHVAVFLSGLAVPVAPKPS
jgi:hypothetical protein